jgi:hypothetical protein
MKKQTPFVFFCLALLLLIGCQSGGDSIEPGASMESTNSGNEDGDAAVKEIRSPENNDTGKYWDGGEWGDQSVVSLEHGISQAARAEVVACGLNVLVTS